MSVVKIYGQVNFLAFHVAKNLKKLKNKKIIFNYGFLKSILL